ncbi:MAG TPA: hypothetical protein VK283_06210 [Acidimicrobiales bacterium]|nr:hypothetical protein [Acidimicrobiales bacterium]
MPDYFPPTRQIRQRRRTAWIVVGILAILAVIFVAFPSSLSPGKHPDQSSNGPSTTLALSHVVSTYEAVLSQYQAALAPPNAVIADATTDLAKQQARAQNDAAAYSAHESGSACAGNALNPGLYQSCLTSEQQTAASVLSDENVANDAAKADVSRQVAGVQQIEAAITALTQQLAGIPWPSSDSTAVSSLTRALGNYGGAYAQTATDLTNGKPISTGSAAIAAAGSAVATQLVNMATTLGIAPPSSPPTS